VKAAKFYSCHAAAVQFGDEWSIAFLPVRVSSANRHECLFHLLAGTRSKHYAGIAVLANRLQLIQLNWPWPVRIFSTGRNERPTLESIRPSLA